METPILNDQSKITSISSVQILGAVLLGAVTDRDGWTPTQGHTNFG